MTERSRPENWLSSTLGAEQERWFLWVPVALGAGSALYFTANYEPDLTPLAAITAVSMAAYWALRRRSLWVVIAGAIAAFVTGALLAKLRTEFVRAPVLAKVQTQTDVNGWVELVEPRTTRGQRVTVRVHSMLKLPPHHTPERVRVRTLVADATLTPGQFIAFRATLSPPPAPAFPNSYDFGFSAYYMGLGAVGIATGPVRHLANTSPAPPSLKARAVIESVRYRITQRIMAALPGETGAIAAALITGERGGITDDTNSIYRDSGLFHILSISGLHMVIMAGAIFVVARVLFAAIPYLALRYPIKKWAAVVALVGALGYLLISGAAFATVRSYIMITVMFYAVLLDRPAVALRNVALSAMIILVVFPESVLDPGFQMSFAAVTALVAVHEALRARRERRDQIGRGAPPMAAPIREVTAILISTIIASIAVSPFSIYHFHNTQTLALIANVVAIPVCNLIVMPAALAVLLALPFGFEILPLTIMGWGVDIMTWIASKVAVLPGAVARVPAISTTAFALLTTGGLWVLLWSRALRYLGLPVIVAGITLAPNVPRPDVILGRDGGTFAVRSNEGWLTAPETTQGSFEVTRWLEIDGDQPAGKRAIARPAPDKSSAIACDQFGCTAEVRGRRISVLNGAGGLRDACGHSDLIVLRFIAQTACSPLGRAIENDLSASVKNATTQNPLLVDAIQLGEGGVHALYFRGPAIHIERVEDRRAMRPWGSRGDQADDPRRNIQHLSD